MALPRTLIQIHYHNRAGGVTTVMGRYARAFARLTDKRGSESILVCNACTSEPKETALRHVPACRYRRFRTREAFARVREELIDRLGSLIFESSLPRPVCVIGHNLTLGKNLALSSAFSKLAAGQTTRGGGVRFFSVVHDFAENGRRGELRQIRRVQSWGWPVWEDLYRSDGTVDYVAVNRCNRNLLAGAGLPARLLLNPLERYSELPTLEKSDRKAVADALARLAHENGGAFYQRRRSYFYPVRVISRKNVVEAILLCCAARGSNLLIGGAGASKADRTLFSQLRQRVKEYQLSVIFDIERLKKYLPRRLWSSHGIIALLYAYCTRTVSTSIAEGFGYALFEPWLFGSAVVGRMPMGPKAVPGMELSHLYSRLGLPVDLVSVRTLGRRYAASLNRSLGMVPARERQRFLAEFFRFHVHNGTVDFAVLDQPSQLEILDSVLSSPSAHSVWLHRWGREIRLQEARFRPESAAIAANREAVSEYLGPHAFDRRFARCFSTGFDPVRRSAVSRPETITSWFASPSRWRLLLSAE